jgi:hypothetical protein
MKDYNPLDILGEREVKTMPPHFSKIKIFTENIWIDDFHEIQDWIVNKLSGRFCIKKMPTIGSDSKIKSSHFVGFEDSKELTYFMLACPHIRR